MATRAEAVRWIAARELRAAARGRALAAFALLFALLACGIALAGLGGSGRVLVQGFTRTSVSLLTLALYLLPLLGAVLGAAAFRGDDGDAELLLAQPVGRGEVLLGRALGLAGAMALVSAAGFAPAGLLTALRTGTAGLGGYLAVAAGATAVGWVGLAVGLAAGVVVRGRAAAVGAALGAWLAAAVLYDLACIAILQLAGGDAGPLLLGMLAANPIDGVRALALVGLGADVLLGPTGAAMQRMLGGAAGAAAVLGSLVFWMVAPLSAAGLVFARRDL